MAAQGELAQLGYGIWYGKQLGSRSVAGFCISEMEPEVWGDEIPTHSHAEAHLLLPLRGKYISECVGAASSCISSSVIYHPPGVIHRDHFESSNGLFLGVSISRERFASIESNHLPIDATSVQQPVVVDLVRKLGEERRLWDSNSEIIIEGLCVELLGRLARAFHTSTPFKPTWLKPVLEYLQDNLHRDVTLTSLAQIAQVSEFELVREFRRHMQCSPGSYVRAKRMERARNLLLVIDTPLADIALTLGFSDQSAFHKAFRKAEGCTPGTYRKQNKGLRYKPPSPIL